jgi:hypothetical protein
VTQIADEVECSASRQLPSVTPVTRRFVTGSAASERDLEKINLMVWRCAVVDGLRGHRGRYVG